MPDYRSGSWAVGDGTFRSGSPEWVAIGSVVLSSLQSLAHAEIRTDSGTALHYNADFIALMKSDLGVTDGSYNGLLIQWLQDKLGSSETSLGALMNLAAADRGVSRWQEITDPTAIGT